MRAFERVNRAIQRLCSGYTSLPGLLEWGRNNAARLEASGRGGDDGRSLGGGYAHVTIGSQNSIDPGSGGDDGWNPLPTRGVTAAAGFGGRRKPWIKHNPIDGQRSAQSGMPVTGISTNALSGSFDRGLVSPEDASVGARSASLALSLSSASAASLPGRTVPAPSWQSTAQETGYYLPKMTRGGARELETGSIKDVRRRLKTAGHTGGGAGSGGILCVAEYDQSVAGSAWWGGNGTKATVEAERSGHDLSSVGSQHDGGASSSVASMLKEERAFQRRNGTLHG